MQTQRTKNLVKQKHTRDGPYPALERLSGAEDEIEQVQRKDLPHDEEAGQVV